MIHRSVHRGVAAERADEDRLDPTLRLDISKMLTRMPLCSMSRAWPRALAAAASPKAATARAISTSSPRNEAVKGPSHASMDDTIVCSIGEST